MEESKKRKISFRSKCFAQRLVLFKLNPFPSGNHFDFTGLFISRGNRTDGNWTEVTNVNATKQWPNYENAIKVAVTPKKCFSPDEWLCNAEQNGEKNFVFGQNWNLL